MRAALINYFVGSAYRSASGYEIKTFLDVGTHQELWDWQQEHFVKLYHVDAHYNGDRFAQVVQVCPPASLKCTGAATRRLVQIWLGELIIILHLNCAERSRHPDATHANNIGVSANTAPEQKRDLRQLPAVCGICRRLLCRCYSTTQSPKILLCILTRLACIADTYLDGKVGLAYDNTAFKGNWSGTEYLHRSNSWFEYGFIENFDENLANTELHLQRLR